MENFKLTITPNITVAEIFDLPYHGKDYDLTSSIDRGWFKQIKVTQQEGSTAMEVDFSIKDTSWEIHDCFVVDFMWIINDLNRKTNRNFVVNSEECVVSNDDMTISVKIVDNAIVVKK